ncbi:hypothetical protein LguiB_006901 [Lonicera macranthoides]
MEARVIHPLPNSEDPLVTRLVSDVPPAHYTFNINSFSELSKILSKTGLKKYESGNFEIGGYKWTLLLYPDGDKERGGEGHISLSLVLAKTNSLPLGLEVNASFKFFVYDQIRDKYLTIEYENRKERRFQAIKNEWGVPKLLALTTFNNAANGYLINNCCIFGVEVFVRSCTGKGESFSVIRHPQAGRLSWKVKHFSSLSKRFICSRDFTVGGHKWHLLLYPKGDSTVIEGNSLSFFLRSNDSMGHPGQKIYVEYTLRVRNQVAGNHKEQKGVHWFSANARGWSNFMLLSDLTDKRKGYMVKGTVIVEVEITRPPPYSITSELYPNLFERKRSEEGKLLFLFVSFKESLELNQPPAHYTLKLNSFSQLAKLLSDTGVEKYESGEFEVSGYKWKLLLYPNGDKNRGGSGHISLYLVLSETNALRLGLEVHASFRFFVYDQIRDDYLVIQDADMKEKRFHAFKIQREFSKLLAHSTLIDAANGYLVDDCCIFGAEVFVTNCTGKGESFSIIKQPTSNFSLPIDRFSSMDEYSTSSEKFIIGGHKWHLIVYPKGDAEGKDQSLSLFLELDDSIICHGKKIYVEYKFRYQE